MKKLYIYLMTALVAMTFAGCEDRDADEARTLDGSWTGYIDTYYQDRWGLTGNSYRTTMFFYQRDRYGGTGYEVDYDLRTPYHDYYYCEFRWDVYNGEIRIQYDDSWHDVYIYDYELYRDYFAGYMDDGTNRDIRFELYYDGGFDWNGYRYNSYYAPTRGSEADSTQTVSAEGRHYHASGVFAR